MGISPWYQGITAPAWDIVLVTDDNGTVDLSGLTPNDITLEIHNITSGQTVIGQGTLSIVQANPGKIAYQLASGDVATPGNYQIAVIVNYSNGPAYYGPMQWQVMPR